MEGSPQKRSSPSDGGDVREDPSKRQRTATLEPEAVQPESVPTSTTNPTYDSVNHPTSEDLGRDGLRRSIALTLNHVGFDSASDDAMESFTELADTYVTGFLDQLTRTANAARRVDPTPTDFETILRRHNISVSSLKPHRKPPIPQKQLAPSFHDPIAEDLRYFQTPRPFLGDELDGTQEKEEKAWIPKTFPPFPSKHTYRFTPVEEVARDPQKKRAEASADARNGEKALRRIDRAAKISRQKELKEIAERNPLSKQRHQAWENLMTDLLPRSGASNGATEIADHSTIVNASAKYGRREVPKVSRRGPAEIFNGQA